ncbi:hypothetical protein NHJ13734_009726 [Beauveria thailandica]
MKGSITTILMGWLWFFLTLLAAVAGACPTLCQPLPQLQPQPQPQPQRPSTFAGEKFPLRVVELDALTPDSYKQLLDDVRGQLQSCLWQEAVALLPPQTPNVTAQTLSWFDLKLRTERHAVTVRLNAETLYFLAYRVENVENPEWRALFDAVPLIPGSRALPGGFTYSRLETQADRRRENITLGLTSFSSAVNYLARNRDNPTNRGESQKLARSILVVVQMLCEALRFRHISNRLAAYNANITAAMARAQTSWADIGEAVIRSEIPWTPQTPLLTRCDQADSWHLWTQTAAVAALALALQPAAAASSSNGQRDDEGPDQCGVVPLGHTLLEVYFVRIDNIDGEDPGELYGRITVTDGVGTETLFQEELISFIQPGQDVPLTGPPRAMSGADAFSIDLDLWDRDRPPDPTPDDEVARGSVLWNPANPRNEYDTAHYEMVTGAFGRAMVRYAVLRQAITATVSVVLARGDENLNDLCGTITAATRLDKVVLFNVPCLGDSSVPVGNAAPIPLRRSVLAVPLVDSLVIEARLWDWDQLSSDDEIANGQQTFTVYDETPKAITGEKGKVDVTVQWSDL